LTEPLQVGQFAIVDGEPVDRGPNAGVFHGKGPTDDRAELFLLAEGTTPAGEAFAGHVISALGHSFASLDMSLTGSLTRLFLESERNVQDWNRKSIAQHRVAIGLSAFGRRGDQAVIAQAGPSVAFHLHNGEVTVFTAEGEHARPIGAAPVKPQLTRIPFERGDRLLLISSRALRELDDELIAGILTLPEAQILPDLYRRVQQLRQVTVLLVTGPQPRQSRTAPEREPEAEPEQEYVIGATGGESEESPLDGNFQPSLFIDDEGESIVRSARAQLVEVAPRPLLPTVVPAIITDIPAPLLRASGDSAFEMNRLAAEGAARAARSRAAAATVEAETENAGHRPNWRSRQDEHIAYMPANGDTGTATGRPRKSQSFSRGLVPADSPVRALPEMARDDVPIVDDLAAVGRARANILTATPMAETLASENGAALNGGTPLVRPRNSMGGRWKGGNAFGGRTAVGGQLPPAWLVILGAMLILFLIAGALTVPRLLSGDNSQEVASLLGGAEQRIVASSSAIDPAQKRQLLTEAQAMLLEARDLGSGPETDALISQVAGVISAMDNIQQPEAVETIASLQRFGTKPLAVARLAVGAEAAYLLDANSAQVVSVPLAGGEPRVVFQENKDEKRAKPVALAVLEESELGGPALLIADSDKHLYAFSEASGLRAIAFAAGSGMTVTDIAVRGRDLFVLDSPGATIYQFIQTPAGFPNAPLKVVASPDLAGARRLTAGAEFITVDADGTVHRFLNGGNTAITFSQSGIDERLVAPETAQALEGGELAILDAPNDRIVVLREDGGFDRQYQHADFASASAFAMRDGVGFLFSGGTLRRVKF